MIPAYRTAVLARMPEYFTLAFDPREPDRIGIDNGFAYQALADCGMSPDDSLDDLTEVAALIGNAFSVMDRAPFETLLGRPSDAATLSLANQILATERQRLVYAGLMTPEQIFRGTLG